MNIGRLNRRLKPGLLGGGIGLRQAIPLIDSPPSCMAGHRMGEHHGNDRAEPYGNGCVPIVGDAEHDKGKVAEHDAQERRVRQFTAADRDNRRDNYAYSAVARKHRQSYPSEQRQAISASEAGENRSPVTYYRHRPWRKDPRTLKPQELATHDRQGPFCHVSSYHDAGRHFPNASEDVRCPGQARARVENVHTVATADAVGEGKRSQQPAGPNSDQESW